MCGRFVLAAPAEEVRAQFGYVEAAAFPPRYNIAPTQPIATVRRFAGARHFVLVRWGLVPGWVKDPARFTLLINARAETAAEKPSFRAAMRHRRCLVPASGYYEWRRDPDGGKQPFFIRPRGGGLIGLAGLWEEWCDADGGVIDTGALLTVPANAALAPIHDRMPVVIAPGDFDLWLDVAGARPDEIAGLLRPAADDLLEAVPVSRRVNGARDDDAGLIRPLDPLAEAQGDGTAGGEETPAPAEAAPARARRRGVAGAGKTGGGKTGGGETGGGGTGGGQLDLF